MRTQPTPTQPAESFPLQELRSDLRVLALVFALLQAPLLLAGGPAAISLAIFFGLIGAAIGSFANRNRILCVGANLALWLAAGIAWTVTTLS